MNLLNLIPALFGWLAFNVAVFHIEKDTFDDASQAFPFKSYVIKSWDNWLASLVMIPCLLFIGHKGLSFPDFGVGEITWSDLYYLASGFATEIAIKLIKKAKGKGAVMISLLVLSSLSSFGQIFEANNIVRNNTLSPARVANALDVMTTFTATGTDSYAISPGMSIYAGGNTYTTGDIWRVTFTNANTSGTVTLNVNGDGAIAVKTNGGSNPGVGDIVAGGTYILRYNGTHFRIVGATGGGGGTTYTFNNGITDTGGTVTPGGSVSTGNILFDGFGETRSLRIGDNNTTDRVNRIDLSAKIFQATVDGNAGEGNINLTHYYDADVNDRSTSYLLNGDWEGAHQFSYATPSGYSTDHGSLLLSRDAIGGAGIVASGVGFDINFLIHDASASGYAPLAGIQYTLTDATNASEDSKYVFQTNAAGSTVTAAELTATTFTVDNVAVDTEAYDATGWNADLTVPTKDAVRDKIESLGAQKLSTNFYNVTTISDLQTYIAGLGAGVDVNIWFPAGTYTVTSTITITSKGNVRIWGEGATIVNGLAGATSVFNIGTVTGLWIDGITFDNDANANGVADLNIDGVAGITKITNCTFFDFGTNGQIGILLNDAPANSLTGSLNYAFPGLEISGCNFYNEITALTFDYNSNNAKGIGIYFQEGAEYYKVSTCSFTRVNTAIWSENGANGVINSCEFVSCNARGLTSTGVIYFSNASATNGGKVIISDSKFNHNFSYSIWSDYNVADRPISVDKCEFIANAITAIVFTGTTSTANSVTNCHFERANLHASFTNDPYGAVTERYIYAAGSNNNFSNNQFRAGANVAIATTGTSDGSLIIGNFFSTSITNGLYSLVGSTDVTLGNTNGTLVYTTTANKDFVGGSSIPSYSAAGYSPVLFSNTKSRVGQLSSTTGGYAVQGFTTSSNTATSIFFRGVGGGTSPSVANTVFSATKHNGSTNFTDLSATEIAFHFRNNATNLIEILGSGRTGFGVTTPTANIHIKAGTSTASTAPLKFTSGTNLGTPEAGAVEFDGTNYFVTSSTTRYTVAKTLTATASLNFDLTSVNSHDLTITVTGAADGDAVSVGVPNASATANVIFTWWVSGTNTVTIRASRIDVASGADPANGTFRASVIKY
jgi:hypothetical protein